MKVKICVGIYICLALISCHTGYQKESGQWFWVSYDESVGKRVSQIDQHDDESFSVLENEKYAIEKNSVFILERTIIKDADPKKNF
ncbi:MAG: hypothetical protein IPO92_13340 [Saprospiraceae bacterium]|nr:hypothetical protein [Saprospiraceae bacterium]